MDLLFSLHSLSPIPLPPPHSPTLCHNRKKIMVNVFLFCDFLLPGTKFKSGHRSKEGFVGFSNAHCEQHQQLHEESFPQSVHSWTVASYLDL